MTTDAQTEPETMSLWETIKAEIPFLLMIVAAIFVFRGLIYNMNYIPSESMQPTLEVGDRILVNKFAYGYSGHSILFSVVPTLPGKYGRLFGSLPARGDVVTFKHPRSGTIYIKRVVGLPGDKIEYRSGKLYINDTLKPREKIDDVTYRQHKSGIRKAVQYREHITEDKAIEIFEFSDFANLDDAGPFIVPADNVFVLGDNRDNSADSRDPTIKGVGFLPVERILGRTERVIYSTYRCKKEKDLRCAKRSFFMPVK
ncbi:MAG: signal peptidase I [Pseudomonadota bacterium]